MKIIQNFKSVAASVAAITLLVACGGGTQQPTPHSSSTAVSSVSSVISSSSSSVAVSSSSSVSSVAQGSEFCPADEPCRILPLGDSITEGMEQAGGFFNYQFNGGYRVALFEAAVNDGKSITFVGSRNDGPNTVAGQPFPKRNGGISGETINQINNRIPSPELDDHPNIILLHAGTNDMNGQSNGAIDRLEDLIDDIVANEPDALLVVSNIIPFNGSENAYNSGIPGLVERKASELQADIIFVDMNSGYPSGQLPDGVHPSSAGYRWMGLKWYETIKEHLN